MSLPQVLDTEYLEFVGRVVAAMEKRAGAGGDADVLVALIDFDRRLKFIIETTVRHLRHEPYCYSWSQIGRAIGVTAQTAQERWGHVGGARKVGGQPAHLR